MERTAIISGDGLYLSECLESDLRRMFDSWRDEETMLGYNHIMDDYYEAFCERHRENSRWCAMIIRRQDGAVLGHVGLSRGLPDLSITVYAPYRGMGYGSLAFALAAEYCFTGLKLSRIYAGCYEGNARSRRMLEKCGFRPHPEGNVRQTHIRTGEDRMQHDFVRDNPFAPAAE